MRLLTVFLVGLLTTSLWASRVDEVREKARLASSIVLARVTEARSYYGTDGEIYTDVTIEVASSLKEDDRKSGRTRSFTVKGGSVGDTRVLFTDVPAFVENDASVVFFEGDTAAESLAIRGDVIPELGESAKKVLNDIEETLREDNRVVIEGERQRAQAFLKELSATVAPDAACFVPIGPKWTESIATYKLGASIPAAWNTALGNAVASWNRAGTVFNFRPDAASANEFLFGTVSGTSTLASTRIEFDSANRMRRFTMTFNTAFAWSTGGDSGQFDVENVAAHELGHALGLNHPGGSACGEQTMWASAGAGETKKRSLENGDKAGIASLYAVSGTTPPAPVPAPAPAPAPAPVPAPAPAPAPAASPVLTGLFVFPSAPSARQNFTVYLTGTGFSASLAQIVITGPACPAGCVVNPGFRSSTLAMGSTSLATSGAYTVGIRNGATGTLSATRPLTIR